MKVSLYCSSVTNVLPARIFLAGSLLLWSTLLLPLCHAAEILVQPGDGTLQAAINAASDGDQLVLSEGTYIGNIVIDHPVMIQGQAGSIVQGEKNSHVILIDAPDSQLSGFAVRDSGKDYSEEHSGVFITDKGDRVRVEQLHLQDNLIGIYLKGPEDAVIENNTIIGSQFHRMNDRGNAIYLWNSPGSEVLGNSMQYGRDGIYVTSSTNNRFVGNRMQDLRFAVHYMYTHDSEVSNNISLNNHVGFALMYSHRIRAVNNVSTGDKQRGLFFNFANYSELSHNQVSGGSEKCVFIYNANHNRLHHNRFEDCDIGIHFTAGSEQNSIYQNAFINNRTQVKYVGTRYIEWSNNGSGNFWSDNVAFDLDNNGIADQAYKPNDLVDQIVWRHPLAKLLLNSPAVQILKWAQSEFPGLHPGGVNDSSPLMAPPAVIPYSANSGLQNYTAVESSRALSDG